MLPNYMFAQTFQNDGEKYDVYCDVMYYSGLRKYVKISINNEEYVIKDKDGSTIKTKDGTSTLNLLSKRGWELITASQSQYETSGTQIIHYTVKKEISDDSEIGVGIAKEE